MIKVKRVIIKAPFAHFHDTYTQKIQDTYTLPHISTVLGIHKILFGQHSIDEPFRLGYTLEFEGIADNLMVTYKLGGNGRVYKSNNAKINILENNEFNQKMPNVKLTKEIVAKINNKVSKIITLDYAEPCKDVTIRRYLSNATLTLYTNTESDLECKYTLGLGKKECIAHIEDIKDIQLIDKEGFLYNQFVPLNIGRGLPENVCLLTWTNREKERYEHKHRKLRHIKQCKYNKNYDEELEQNIFLHDINIKEWK